MSKTWVKVFTTTDIFTAELLKQGLTEAEIPATLINKQLSGCNIGEINVLVQPEMVELAKQYILENEIS